MAMHMDLKKKISTELQEFILIFITECIGVPLANNITQI